jgi:hypothetical protein
MKGGDPQIHEDHRDAVSKHIQQHKYLHEGSNVRSVVRADALLAPVAQTHRQEKMEIQIRGPDYDLIPLHVFKKHSNGKSPQDVGVPVISVGRTSGQMLTGILLWANNWNPPPGCWRISSFEAMPFKHRLILQR